MILKWVQLAVVINIPPNIGIYLDGDVESLADQGEPVELLAPGEGRGRGQVLVGQLQNVKEGFQREGLEAGGRHDFLIEE